ncbi:MAG: LacI family DNA-binding transcriptional regulator [Marivivens sp.]|nr:LacI family DNA-binding transcriptional regulator [Marivivens sp.]
MNQKNIATLVDVARRSGVSTATVSRFINTPEKVNKKTRDKVERAISELGYVPNFGARVMAAKRTNTIGAVIPTMENAIFARGLQAFQEGLHDHGFTLLVASSSYNPDIEEEQIRSLVARGADGLLLIGHDRNLKILEFLERHQIPTVAAWSLNPHSRIPSVGFDNLTAMRQIVDAALDYGHRHIGVISAHTKNNDRARERLNAVRLTLHERSVSPENLSIIETDYGVDEGSAAFEELIAQHPSLTAVICGNDVLAVGALKRARELDIRVPDQISITGFDDIEIGQVAFPSLSTVHVPHRAMGSAAAELLAKMITNSAPYRSVELHTSLVLRESLGPARTSVKS